MALRFRVRAHHLSASLASKPCDAIQPGVLPGVQPLRHATGMSVGLTLGHHFRRRLLWRHPNCAVQTNRLPIEHGVGDNLLHQLCKLVRRTQA